jgi:uncharacterized SAM-binding protein YcdF (DUF218 family)
MKRHPQPRPKAKSIHVGFMLGGTIAIGIALGFFAGVVINALTPMHSAILVLGGATSREKFAAQFAQQHPDLPIWVSGGSPKEYSEDLFAKAGIARDRLHLDYRAVDTVTNFTTLVGDLKDNKITDVYVITDAYHMPRAQVIGSVVLGSRGIRMHPVPISSHMEAYLSQHPQEQREQNHKYLRDGVRSVIWVITGSTLTKK